MNRATASQSLALAILAISLLTLCSCSGSGPLNEKAYVLAEKVRLKSTTAQAARYVGELKGGDMVTITDREDAEDGTSWAEVRGPGGEKGWVETRFIVRAELVEEARRLTDQSRNIQTQAIGRSRASLKLRLTPTRTSEDNVVSTLPPGALLEIVSRERKPRPVTSVTRESDNDSAEAAATASNSDERTDVKYDDWYLVRVKDYSVVPGGWIYGGLIGMEIPPEIIYFVSEGYRLTGWHKIGTVNDEEGRSGDHYLVLEKSIRDGRDEYDFEKIKVLAYDPVSRNHLTPFRETLYGQYPVTLSMNGTTGIFQLSAADKSGSQHELRYSIEMLDAGKVKVTKIPGLSDPPRAKR